MATTTKYQFRRLAEKRFQQINPDVLGFTICWKFTSAGFIPNRVGNGATMFGHFVVKAPGYRTKLVMATLARGDKDVSLR